MLLPRWLCHLVFMIALYSVAATCLAAEILPAVKQALIHLFLPRIPFFGYDLSVEGRYLPLQMFTIMCHPNGCEIFALIMG